MTHTQRLRELKRERIKAKREAERREAAALAAAALPTSPRSGARIKRHDYILQRQGGGVGADGEWVPAGSPGLLGPEDDAQLVDSLVVRSSADDDALCAVCADGTSEAPNQIVFCERCDVAVHQGCYGIAEVPAGEWLCWPCSVHESRLRSQGVPREEVRPPR